MHIPSYLILNMLLLRRFATLKPDKILYSQIRDAFFQVFKDQTLVPLYIRLGFHDAGTFDKCDNSGGPHGSIRFEKQLNYPVNRGLKKGMPSLNLLKQSFPQVSYADLIQAGVASAVEFAKGPLIPFKFGRIDAQTDCEVPPEDRLPNPLDDLEKLREIFSRMGLTDADLVALSGGHTVGKDGVVDKPWTHDNTIFNNSYFVELIKKEGSASLIRFPCDKALLSSKETKDLAIVFANNEKEFFKHFTLAQQKLSELGNN